MCWSFRFLLDLFGDEPLEELEAAVVAVGDGDGRRAIELAGDRPLRLERPLRRRGRGREAGRRRLERRQVEVDLVVDQEVDDLLGVLGLLDRLLAEELAPAVEALALEVDRDRQVERVGGQLVADLGDQELAQVGAAASWIPRSWRSSTRAARGSDRRVAHDRIPAAVATERSHRGLVQRFAKPPCGVTCIEGSNPSLSASRRWHSAPVAQRIER